MNGFHVNGDQIGSALLREIILTAESRQLDAFSDAFIESLILRVTRCISEWLIKGHFPDFRSPTILSTAHTQSLNGNLPSWP
jgi:hypothetical protein